MLYLYKQESFIYMSLFGRFKLSIQKKKTNSIYQQPRHRKKCEPTHKYLGIPSVTYSVFRLHPVGWHTGITLSSACHFVCLSGYGLLLRYQGSDGIFLFCGDMRVQFLLDTYSLFHYTLIWLYLFKQTTHVFLGTQSLLLYTCIVVIICYYCYHTCLLALNFERSISRSVSSFSSWKWRRLMKGANSSLFSFNLQQTTYPLHVKLPEWSIVFGQF